MVLISRVVCQPIHPRRPLRPQRVPRDTRGIPRGVHALPAPDQRSAFLDAWIDEGLITGRCLFKYTIIVIFLFTFGRRQ